MKVVTLSVQERIVEIFSSLRPFIVECASIDRDYFGTDASTKVGALANNTDTAAVAAKLTKLQYLQGVTLAQQIKKFFNNEELAQGNYIIQCVDIKYANAASAAIQSQATEEVGTRIKNLCSELVSIHESIERLLDVYFSNQLHTAFGSLDAHRKVFGADMSVSQLVSAITLCEKLKDLLTNVAPTQGAYEGTLSNWEILLEE